MQDSFLARFVLRNQTSFSACWSLFSSSKLQEFRISAAAGIEFSVERAAGSSRAHVPGVHASDLKN
jgi:hypothetical protein